MKIKVHLPLSKRSSESRAAAMRFVTALDYVSPTSIMGIWVKNFFESSSPFGPGLRELRSVRKDGWRFHALHELTHGERERFLVAWDERKRFDRYFVGIGKRRKAHRRRRKA